MALPIFAAFRSTVTNFLDRVISSQDRWLVHPVTGAVVGVKNPNANGADARFTPVDVTADQIASPSALMVADLDAVYRLDVAPYTRYQSDGSTLTIAGGSAEVTIVPPGINLIYYAPLTISPPDQLIVQGQVQVRSYPA